MIECSTWYDRRPTIGVAALGGAEFLDPDALLCEHDRARDAYEEAAAFAELNPSAANLARMHLAVDRFNAVEMAVKEAKHDGR